MSSGSVVHNRRNRDELVAGNRLIEDDLQLDFNLIVSRSEFLCDLANSRD
jgi:hypothetical protein